jgi:hypothetical protein
MSERDAIDLAAYDSRIHKVIRANAVRHGWEAVQDRTPLDELIGGEPVDPADQEEEKNEDETRARQEHFHGLLRWIFGDGPHPVKVMRRLFLLTYQFAPEYLGYPTQADLGMLLGDKKQHQNYRLRVLFRGMARSRSQKREGSSKTFSRAQEGNTSRRKGEWRKKQQRSKATS